MSTTTGTKNNMQIVLKRLTAKDCDMLLDGFDRRQSTKREWKLKNGRYILEHSPYDDDWSHDDRRRIERYLVDCISSGGMVEGAYSGRDLLGFVSVDGAFLEGMTGFVNMEYLHVAKDFRGKGIGSILFSLACDFARGMGADKLYISANPAEETVAFYRAVGCDFAALFDRGHVDNSPYDCQLEYKL